MDKRDKGQTKSGIARKLSRRGALKGADPTALISAYIHYEVSFINKSEATKKAERPKSKRQMYKCREPLESCSPVNSILRR